MKTLLMTTVFASLCAPLSAQTVSSCDDASRAIPDGDPSGVSVALDVDAPLRTVTGVRLELVIQHPWVGDLVVTLVAPDGVTAVRVLDRPGTVPAGFPGPWGCGGDDIDATFDDQASATVMSACTITGTPVYAGDISPQDPLAGFAGVDADGVWTLIVADAQGVDAGGFVRACIVVETEAPTGSCLADFDGSGVVDLTDFGVFGAEFGRGLPGGGPSCVPVDPCVADFDGNGAVDLTDFGVFGAEFGRGLPGGGPSCAPG